MARKGFWDRFDALMSSLPDCMDNEIDLNGSSVFTSSKSVVQTSSFGKSSTAVKQDGKTVIKVDGVEYTPKAK